MPLVTGTIAPPPPAPPTTEQMKLTWTAPDGSIWPLTETCVGYHARAGVIGWGAAPVVITSDANARGGATVRHIQAGPRLITLPLTIKAPTQTEFLPLWRGLGRAFASTRRLGPGTLSVQHPDGSMREIDCYYQDGFANNPELSWKIDQPILTLFCPDPYWRNPVETTIIRSFVASSDDTFFSPFLHLTSSQTLGDTTVTNPGDVDAWPTWKITGPASGLVATRNDTGDSFTFTPIGGDMAADDVATIVTEPPSITGPDGTSWVGAINWPSGVLWGLPPGDTSVTFTVSGSAAGTSIELSFHPRYETY